MTTAKEVQQFIENSAGFDNKVMQKVNITSLKDGNLTAEIIVSKEHTNIMGGLHGGFSATLVDSLSSIALLSHTDIKKNTPSVSVDLHVTYLKGAKVGDELLVEAKTIRTGQNLAFLEVVIRNKATGDILIKGNQTQFLLRNSGNK